MFLNRTRLETWIKELIPSNKESGKYKGIRWSLVHEGHAIKINEQHYQWDRELAMKYIGLVSRSPEYDAMAIIDYHYEITTAGLKRRTHEYHSN